MANIRAPFLSARSRWLRGLRRIGRRPRLIDAFLLFNEIDLLEIRLSELEHVVDTFVIVESDRTFAGRPKPYFFEQWRHRFGPWLDKIVYRRLRFPNPSLTDDEGERFLIEKRHRDGLGRALAKLELEQDDIVVISDIDEIWRASRAADIRRALRRYDSCVMVLRNYRGYVNNVSPRALNGIASPGPVACPQAVLAQRKVSHVRQLRLTPQRKQLRSLISPRCRLAFLVDGRSGSVLDQGAEFQPRGRS